MLSCPRLVLRSLPNDMKPVCQINALFYISWDYILYICLKQVNKSVPFDHIVVEYDKPYKCVSNYLT